MAGLGDFPPLSLQQIKVLSVGPAIFPSQRQGLRLQVERDRGLQALGASLPRAGGAQGGGRTLAEAGASGNRPSVSQRGPQLWGEGVSPPRYLLKST